MRTNLVIRFAVAVLVFGGGSWVASTQQLPHRPMVAHKVKGDLYMLEGQGATLPPTSPARVSSSSTTCTRRITTRSLQQRNR
jgi:hypothetical protein